jgi:hypothetical protein
MIAVNVAEPPLLTLMGFAGESTHIAPESALGLQVALICPL